MATDSAMRCQPPGRRALASHLAQRSPAEVQAWRREHVRLAGRAALHAGITSFKVVYAIVGGRIAYARDRPSSTDL